MNDLDAALGANLEFYRAFTERDLEAMERLWASTHEIACTHPGWSVLTGRAAVMTSWRNILGNPDSPPAACTDERCFLLGDLAIVLCEEELPGNTLAATNVFAKEDGVWRMVHHHAGPIFARQPDPPRAAPPGRLN